MATDPTGPTRTHLNRTGRPFDPLVRQSTGDLLQRDEVDLNATVQATNGWQADRAHDTASRSIGQDMQRGPPRPRPSSPPAMVTISMPLRRRNVLVVVFRS